MLRTLWFVAALALVGFAPSQARAEPPAIVVANPGEYARSFTERMSGGIVALREEYQAVLRSATVPPQVDAALTPYERIASGRRALVARVVEDMVLADSIRTIYGYYYYGDNAWLFVRMDFVRTGDSAWAVSGLTFHSEWAGVVTPSTPGFSRQ
jgi:hypothetical protein